MNAAAFKNLIEEYKKGSDAEKKAPDLSARSEVAPPKEKAAAKEKEKAADLDVYSRAAAQAEYNFSGKLIGRGWVGRYSSAMFPPAVIEAPKAKEPPQDEAERRKREYKKNILTLAELTKPTPDVIKSKNPQGLRQYVFVNELIACKNGFLYYLIPFFIGVVFLIVNLFKHAFFVNVVAAVFALVLAFSVWKFAKNIARFRAAFWYVVLAVLLVVGYVLILKFVPGFAEQVYYPFALKLVIIVFDIYYCARFYTYFMLAYAGDCQLDFGNVVQVKFGPPRSGKTSSAVQDAKILSLMKWQQLQYEFQDWHSREAEIFTRNNFDEITEYKAIKESYFFYVMRPCIPCLWSNFGIEDDRGYRSHKITLDHLRGVKRLPMYCVVVLDEIGAALKAELSNDRESRPYDVSDMFRLGGHYLKWSVIACEQDFNNIYIDCRRVVGFNQGILGQTWVCRPGLLNAIFNTLKFIVSNSADKKIKRHPRFFRFMHAFEKFVKSIGFRDYRLAYATNTQTSAEITGATADQQKMKITRCGRRIVPSSLVAKYDERAYKQNYPSYFDKSIIGELHGALHIRGSETGYSRQFVNSSKALDEKREATDEEIRALEEAFKRTYKEDNADIEGEVWNARNKAA